MISKSRGWLPSCLSLLCCVVPNAAFAADAENERDGQFVIAGRDIQIGELIGEDAVKASTDANRQTSGDFATDLSAIVGARSRVRISAGQAIRLSDIRRPYLVRSGEQVRLDIRSGAVTVTLTGTAMRSGRAADIIPVRSTDPAIVVHARIAADGTLSIEGPE